MAKNTMDVTAFVGKLLSEDEPDVLHEGIRLLAELLMDAEVSAAIGAERYERTRIGRRIATGAAPAGGIRVWERSSCGSRRSRRAATSRRF